MRTRVAAVAASLTLLAAMAAGCSGTSTNGSHAGGRSHASAGPPPDPCTLVTLDDLKKALGEDFEQSSSPPLDPGRQTCSYSHRGHNIDVNTYADTTGTGNADAAYANLLQAAKDIGGTPVALQGIGDQAFRTDSSLNCQLTAEIKGWLLSIVFVGLDQNEATDKAIEEVGRAAAART